MVQRFTGKTVSAKHSRNFPINWVTDLFNVWNVQTFGLHYCLPVTSFHNLDFLLLEMPNLLYIERVVRFVLFQKDDVNILMKVGRCFFDLNCFDHIKSVWTLDLREKFVSTGYVKRAIIYDPTAERLTLSQGLDSWFSVQKMET